MTLRNTILIRVVLLICLLVLALTGAFYWIFAGDVKQRTQQTVEAAFLLLEDNFHRKQREMAREAEKVNYPVREMLDRVAAVRRTVPPQQAEQRHAWLQSVVSHTAPLADHLFSLADALGRDGMQIALYTATGQLLLLYTADDTTNKTVYLFLPELKQDALLIQRQKTVLVGGSRTRTLLDEKRFRQLDDLKTLESIPLPEGLRLQIPPEAVAAPAREQFVLLSQTPSIQYQAPVHAPPPGFDYFAPVDQSKAQVEPNNGLLELTLQLKTGDIQQIAAMTRTEINTFVNGTMACGTLHTYNRFAGATAAAPLSFGVFVTNPPVRPVTSRAVSNHDYYESHLTIGNSNGPVATVAILLSRKAEQHATLVMMLTIAASALLFCLLAVFEAIRFSGTVAQPISRIVSSMQRLARGDLGQDDRTGTQEQAAFTEVRQMDNALDELIKASAETVNLAETIAAGDLRVQVTPRSEQDRMMDSLNQMVQQLNEHNTRTMQAIEEAEVLNQALTETNHKLETLSSTDALTGIANRRQFDRVLTREYARHARSGAELSLILLDVDFFKRYNDHYGHLQGDDCLRQIGSAMATCILRPPDLVARYGGEEFACILPETGLNGALEVAERIRLAILELAIPHACSSVAGHVSASLGVVTACCKLEQPPDRLLELADQQLYRAKESGRNRVACHAAESDEPQGIPFLQLAWSNDLRSGNQLIDSQHQALFMLANQLFEAIQQAEPKPVITLLVTRLLDDLQQHFRDEEQILQAAGFPGLDQHTQEHARLMQRRQTLAEACACNTLAPQDVCSFLVKDMVMEHLLTDDRQFFDFLNSRNQDVIAKDQQL